MKKALYLFLTTVTFSLHNAHADSYSLPRGFSGLQIGVVGGLSSSSDSQTTRSLDGGFTVGYGSIFMNDLYVGFFGEYLFSQKKRRKTICRSNLWHAGPRFGYTFSPSFIYLGLAFGGITYKKASGTTKETGMQLNCGIDRKVTDSLIVGVQAHGGFTNKTWGTTVSLRVLL